VATLTLPSPRRATASAQSRGEFAVDVPAEDFEELGAADVVELGVQAPGTVGFLVDAGGAAQPVAFGLLGGPDRDRRVLRR
jgi:hypothetical protein